MSDLPEVSAILDGSSVEDWKEDFFTRVTNLDPPRLFYKVAGEKKEAITLWVVFPGSGPAPITSVEEWRGKLHALCNTTMNVRDRTTGQQLKISTPMKYEMASLLFHDHRLHQEHLPELDVVVAEPLVIFDKDRTPLITPPGFLPWAGIYRNSNSFTPSPLPITDPETSHLARLFSSVPFASPHYRNNLLAWALGAVVYDRALRPPLLAITGNRPGIGKTITLDTVSKLLTGQEQSPISPYHGEFKKQLSAKFRQGNRFITFDNLTTPNRKHYENAELCELLTGNWSKEVRILGHSKNIYQKGVLFALTANNCRLDYDLALRTLKVKLHRLYPEAFELYPPDYVNLYREQLYGELLWLATRTDLSDVPDDPSIKRFRYPAWAKFVYPRIRKYFGPMAIESALDLDAAASEFFAWGDNNLTQKFTLDSFTKDSNVLFDSLKHIHMRCYSDSFRERTERYEAFLVEMLGQQQTFAGHTIRFVKHGATYHFEETPA